LLYCNHFFFPFVELLPSISLPYPMTQCSGEPFRTWVGIWCLGINHVSWKKFFPFFSLCPLWLLSGNFKFLGIKPCKLLIGPYMDKFHFYGFRRSAEQCFHLWFFTLGNNIHYQ
jgi:hypothetical protein